MNNSGSGDKPCNMNELIITRNPALDNGKRIEKPKFYDIVSLTVEESPFNLKERTIAIIDPKVMRKLCLTIGDVIEITGASGSSNTRTKIYAVLWCGRSADRGKNIIRIDPCARMKIGIAIGEKATIRKVKSLSKAELIVLTHSERLVASSLEKKLLLALEGTIVSVGMVIPIEILGRTSRFLVVSIRPSSMPAVTIDSKITRILIKPVRGSEWQQQKVPESESLGNGEDKRHK